MATVGIRRSRHWATITPTSAGTNVSHSADAVWVERLSKTTRPRSAGPPLGHLRVAPRAMRVDEHEDVRRSVADVLVVVARRPAGLRRHWDARLADHDLARPRTPREQWRHRCPYRQVSCFQVRVVRALPLDNAALRRRGRRRMRCTKFEYPPSSPRPAAQVGHGGEDFSLPSRDSCSRLWRAADPS